MTARRTTLAYCAPARSWEREALPIGNGRLGAMLLGEAGAARLVLNVSSLWTGGENPGGVYDDDGFGNYQVLGELSVRLDRVSSAAVTRYSRRLDLGRAIHHVSYECADGTRYEEEAFASQADQVLAWCVRSSRELGASGRLQLSGAHGETTVASENSLIFGGNLSNGLRYCAHLAAVAEGGTVHVEADELRFEGCRSLCLLLAAGTDYAFAPERSFRGEPPEQPVKSAIAGALTLGWARLSERHTRDHASLFERTELELGTTAPDIAALPHDARVAGYEPGRDPELLTTLFHYGRYLLIASARPGGLPPNLQGLWNESNQPPWHADYHTNINVQMCLWAAEPTALAECHQPLFDLLEAMLPACRRATRAELGDTPGFAYRTSHNVFGGQGWEWNLPANAWYALHFWEHFAFGVEREFLEQRAMPYLREVSEFWLHRLKVRDDGALVAPAGWSPEHGPVEDGVTYDQALVAELFDATLAAASELAQDDELVRRVRDARARLLAPAIGRFGQLKEWAVDRDDPDDQHRHTSHLVGVFPGASLNRERSPALARAAEVSLRARGDSGDARRSWTWPWRALLWARLGSATDAARMLDGYVQHSLLPNLLATHPPLQLDGSLAFPACISELLVQSHAGVLELLPALDFGRWPRGSFRGLRARGGFVVSARWNERGVIDAEILSFGGRSLVLRVRPAPARVEDAGGLPVELERLGDGCFRFETTRNAAYRIRCE